MSGFSAINYALSKKLDSAILTGVVSHTVDDVNKTITFTFNDGTSSTIQFNNPSNGADGVGIATMHKDTNNHLIVSLTDGSNIDVGELPVGTTSGPVKEITNITYLNSKLTFTFSDGTNRTVTVNPKLSELSDVSISSPSSGQVLVYNGATNKFINSSISTTDQYVKMTSADINGSYLADLIDNDTLINNNNKLEVNKIKGQQITVDELNTLIGMDANVKDSLNAIATGGMVFKDVVPTKADLPQGALNGFVYIVNSDETDNGNRNAYIYSDEHGDYVLVGTSGLEVRNFTTNPINLETEVTGILPSSKIDTTGLVNKTTDVVSSLTYPIPDGDLNKIADLNVLKQINTEVANALNNKLDKSAIATVINDTVTGEQVASAKATNNIYKLLNSKINGDVVKTDIISYAENLTSKGFYPLQVGGIDETNVPYQTYSYTNGFIMRTGATKDNSRITIVLFPRTGSDVMGNKIAVNTKYNTDNWTGWKYYGSSSVADVPETLIEIDENALGIPIWNNRSKYKVINGICYVTFELNINAHSTDKQYGYDKINITSLPKIGFSTKGILNIQDSNSITAVLDKETTDIKLHGVIRAKEGSYALQGSFSYPVAE